MGAFEYRQAEEIRDIFARHGVRYLFLGKSGAILLGFPDTTQDADVFLDKSPANGRAVTAALRDLGFSLTDAHVAEIERGKDFVQLKDGPFDIDLVFAPDGIERFDEAWRRRVDIEGFPVCHIDDIIASKVATGRAKDRESPAIESLPRVLGPEALELQHCAWPYIDLTIQPAPDEREKRDPPQAGNNSNKLPALQYLLRVTRRAVVAPRRSTIRSTRR